MKIRITNYTWYVAVIFLVLMGVMQGCCDVFNNCCEDEETIPCLAPYNFTISEIAYLSENAEVTLSWEARDNADSYTVLYLENGVLNEAKNNITVNTTSFTVDTTALEHSFQIFSNCSNCEGETFVSDTVAVALEAPLIIECPTPTGLNASYDGENLTITFDAVGSDFYDFSEYVIQAKNLNTAIEDLQIVPHPDNSAIFTVLPPSDGSSSFFEINIYQDCMVSRSGLMKGILEIVHDDAYRCTEPLPLSTEKMYLVVCRDGRYSSLQSFLNCHCDGTNLKPNIDPNCN